MTESNIEFVINFFQKVDELAYDKQPKFSDLEKPLYPSEQFSAIVFLYGKLKDKSNKYFLHGEHDELCIGEWKDFEDFTEQELKEAACYGISLNDFGDGFRIYASM